MGKIVTVTLNPCIDKTTTTVSIFPEKKLRCSSPNFEPGGGGINVSRAIKKLGGGSTAIYVAGGYSGSFFKTLLDKEGVDSIVTGIASHTRENLVVLDESSGLQYRFCMPGPTLTQLELQSCLGEIEKLKDIEFIVASGSLPSQTPLSILSELASLAKTKKAKFIVDTSGDALEAVITEGVYLIKPNINELSHLTGKSGMEKNEIITQSRAIIKNGGSEIVVVSLGEEGALLVTNDVSVLFVPPPVKRKSTVGAGDSMVAGIVYSLQQNKPIINAVQYGVACGTAATMNAGTELCRLEDVQALYSHVQLVHQ